MSSMPRSNTTRPFIRTPLIGGAVEMTAARSLLTVDNVPLLTLIGPGGVGKTRIALAIAHDLAESFADGAVFVDLSAIHDFELVLSAVAQAVGVREGSERSLSAGLIASLRP